MQVNIWLALRDDAQQAIREAVVQGEDYTGPVPVRTRKLFEKMYDRATVERLFKTPTVGGRQYTLWSLYFDEDRNVLLRIRDELDALTAAYPNRIIVAGAWHHDGRQVGTQYVFTDVPNPNYNGDTEPEFIPNPAYQPDPGGEIPRDDYDPREFLRNPIYDGNPLVTQVSTTGTPVYPIHPRLLDFMPDNADGSPATSLQDVNVLFGQSPRRFT